jgi:hypothetical protein
MDRNWLSAGRHSSEKEEGLQGVFKQLRRNGLK